MKFVGTVYEHNAVEYRKKDEAYAVFATKDIPVGTLILMEHVLWGTEKQCIQALCQDQRLAADLFPRTFNATIKDKIDYNSFMFFDHYVLGDRFSKYNHSCTPNCYMGLADRINGDQIYGMWTVQNVSAGTELCIDYVNHSNVDYHFAMKKKHGFTCNCDDTFIMLNDQRCNVRVNLGSTFRKREQDNIAKKVDQYMTTTTARHVVKNLCTIHKR